MEKLKMIISEISYALSLLVAIALIPFALLLRGLIEVKLAIKKINLGDKNV